MKTRLLAQVEAIGLPVFRIFDSLSDQAIDRIILLKTAGHQRIIDDRQASGWIALKNEAVERIVRGSRRALRQLSALGGVWPRIGEGLEIGGQSQIAEGRQAVAAMGEFDRLRVKLFRFRQAQQGQGRRSGNDGAAGKQKLVGQDHAASALSCDSAEICRPLCRFCALWLEIRPRRCAWRRAPPDRNRKPQRRDA